MFRIRVNLVRSPQTTERVLIDRRAGYGADGTVFDHLKHVMVESRVGVVGHFAT